MIKSIHVKNFKTLREVEIPLDPKITVMVGANNSGKSNALQMLKLIGEMERRRGREVNVFEVAGGITRGSKEKVHIHVSMVSSGDPAVSAGFTLFSGRESGLGMDAQFKADPEKLQQSHLLKPALANIFVFDFSVTSLRAPSLVQRGVRIALDGKNAAAALDAIAGEKPALRDTIEEEVRRAASDVKRLLTQPGGEPGTKILAVEESDGAVYGANEMSDGLVLFIGLSIAAQTYSQGPGLIAIEQPERNIHPRRMREFLDQCLRVTERGTQIVLTTHSPTLLDEFRDYPESVLIFDRDENGTHVTRLSDKPDWMQDFKGQPLGDIWYSGVLGGVPKRP